MKNPTEEIIWCQNLLTAWAEEEGRRLRTLHDEHPLLVGAKNRALNYTMLAKKLASIHTVLLASELQGIDDV